MSVKTFISTKIHNINTNFSNLRFSVAHFLAMLGRDSVIENFIKNNSLLISPDGFGHGLVFYSIKCKHQQIADLVMDYMCNIVENNKFSFKSYLLLKTIKADLLKLILNSSSIVDLLTAILLPQTMLCTLVALIANCL